MLSLMSCKDAQIPEILKRHPDRAKFEELNNPQWKRLFNGKDLTGWYTYTAKYGKNNDIDKEFHVHDGAIHLDGEAMGYLCTTAACRNYYLRVVFRWGDKKYPPRENSKRDSGILYHFDHNAPDQIWPKSVECQVQEGDCGDCFLVDTDGKSPNTVVDGSIKRIVRTADYEKPAPEWNTIEIVCYGNRSEHYVNGRMVNQISDLSVSEGKILLQLEGAEIFYREISLLPL
jgi:hypothetical protein